MDKRPKDMTQDELDGLPDYFSLGNKSITATTPELAKQYGVKLGDTLIKRHPIKLCASGAKGDDLAFWRDGNGAGWAPIYCGSEFGWAKQPMHF